MVCESLLRKILVATTFGAVVACHASQSPSPPVSQRQAEYGVFTDSVLHAQRCEPIRAGEDWRKVCIPKDQRVDVAKPKKP